MEVRKSWHKVIDPAWQATPAELRALVELVAAKGAAVVVDADGNCDWTPDLRAAFERIPTPLAAAGSMVLARHYQWHPDPDHSARLAGAPGKTCDLLDKMLRQRHGLADKRPSYEKQYGLFLWVHEGLLRVEFDVRGKYGGVRYLGLATDANVAMLKAVRWPYHPGHDNHPLDLMRWADDCRRTCDDLQARQRPTKGHIGKIFDSGCVPNHQAAEQVINNTGEDTANGPARQTGKPSGAPAERPGLFKE